MTYTVNEVAKLSGVTIKTLYHYQKIGLLLPARINENGYRVYGEKELEKLQQILFYRELDFPLQKIKDVMENKTSRLQSLKEQKALLMVRTQRLAAISRTLDLAIESAMKGATMSKKTMFRGLNEQEWTEALQSQNQHLSKEYEIEISTTDIDTESMNNKAQEAQQFMSFLADSLRNHVPVTDKSIETAISKHIKFLQQDLDIDRKSFLAQTQFLIHDSFHRDMMESQQIGLSYYLLAAVESFATKA